MPLREDQGRSRRPESSVIKCHFSQCQGAQGRWVSPPSGGHDTLPSAENLHAASALPSQSQGRLLLRWGRGSSLCGESRPTQRRFPESWDPPPPRLSEDHTPDLCREGSLPPLQPPPRPSPSGSAGLAGCPTPAARLLPVVSPGSTSAGGTAGWSFQSLSPDPCRHEFGPTILWLLGGASHRALTPSLLESGHPGRGKAGPRFTALPPLPPAFLLFEGCQPDPPVTAEGRGWFLSPSSATDAQHLRLSLHLCGGAVAWEVR